ncbi:MAG: oligosaccharide flippase family protein, partial [Thermoleophilaceae bacterium]
MSLARKVTLNASALGAGRVAAAGLGIVSVAISTRYLGVEAYGALAVALAFSTLLNVVADGGIWTIAARELAKRPEDTQRIFATILTMGLGLSGLAMAIALAVAFLVFGGGDDALTRKGILLLLLTVPLAAPAGAVNAYFIAVQRAWIGAIGVVTSSVVQLIALVVATSLDAGFTGVVGAYVAAAVAQALVIIPLARGRVSLRPAWELALGRQLLGWALPLSGATLVYSLYWRIDILLLSLLASERQVGLYGLSYRVVDALVLLPQFVMVTLLPEFARLADHREHLRQVAQKAFTIMQIGALALVTIFVGFAREIVTVVGGPGFGDAALVLEILVVGVGLTYVGNVLAQVLLAINRQGQLFALALALLPANVLLNVALLPLWGARG